jgi:dihydroxyacetone kinase
MWWLNQVAGAAAAAGLSLAEVTAEASKVAESVGTMGVALSVCTIPGQVASDRLDSGKMELGLGIVSILFFLFEEHMDWYISYNYE